MSRRRRKETEEQRARRELISDFLSAANIQSMDDIQALFKEALAGFMEGSLESELDDELGYEPYDVKNKETDNSLNGHRKNTLRTSNIRGLYYIGVKRLFKFKKLFLNSKGVKICYSITVACDIGVYLALLRQAVFCRI